MRIIQENLGNIVVGLIVAAMIGLAIRSVLKKNGCCSCGASCSFCEIKGKCHIEKQQEQKKEEK